MKMFEIGVPGASLSLCSQDLLVDALHGKGIFGLRAGASQMKVGDQPRRAIARASGAQSGPYPSSSSKVRWHFSPRRG